MFLSSYSSTIPRTLLLKEWSELQQLCHPLGACQKFKISGAALDLLLYQLWILRRSPGVADLYTQTFEKPCPRTSALSASRKQKRKESVEWAQLLFCLLRIPAYKWWFTPNPVPLVRTGHMATTGHKGSLGNVVPDRAAIWQLPLHTMELEGQILVDKPTFLTRHIFCIFSMRRKNIFSSPLETALEVRWHTNFSHFLCLCVCVFPSAALLKNDK